MAARVAVRSDRWRGRQHNGFADLRARRACGQVAVTLDVDKRVGAWRKGLAGQSLPAISGLF
jgi:hypothetical protein